MLVWLEALEGPAKPSIQNISVLPQGPPRRYLLSVNSASMDGNGARGQVFFVRAFLRTFGVDARRWLRWILNSPRRSFKLRVLVNRQRPMKNVTFDRATVLQLDANGTDSALDAAADCHILRNDAALDMCAIADLEIRGAHLAFDSAEDLRWTFAFDVADDR